jgi:hypothetical protein
MVFPDSNTLLAQLTKSTGPRFRQLNKAVAKLVDGFGMVSFTALDLTEEDRCETAQHSHGLRTRLWKPCQVCKVVLAFCACAARDTSSKDSYPRAASQPFCYK